MYSKAEMRVFSSKKKREFGHPGRCMSVRNVGEIRIKCNIVLKACAKNAINITI